MIARYYFLFLLLTFMLSCERKDSYVRPQNCPGSGFCAFEIYPNSELDSSEGVKIIEGNKNVFKYTFKSYDDPRIEDDGSIEVIYFEVDEVKNNFTYGAKNISQINAFINYINPQTNSSGVYKIDKGDIKGIKISSDKWRIELDFIIKIKHSTYQIQLTEIFQIK